MQDRKPAVIDLAHRIDVAQCLVGTARAHLASAHDRLRDAEDHLAADRYISQIQTQVEGAESRLAEQLEVLQTLERERDEATLAEHTDEVHADIVALLDDAIALHGADAAEVVPHVTARLTERVALMSETLDAQRHQRMRTAHLSHALDVAHAALHLVTQCPDRMARLMPAVSVAPEWSRRTSPPMAAALDSGPRTHTPEPLPTLELDVSEVEEDLPGAVAPPEADWSREGAEVISVEAEVFGALRALEHDAHDPERWDELGELLDECEHPDVRAVCLERMARARRAVGGVGQADPLFDAMLQCSHAEIAEDPEDYDALPTPVEQVRTAQGAELVEWPDATVTVVDEYGRMQSWPNMASAVRVSVRFERLRAQDAADAEVIELRGGER